MDINWITIIGLLGAVCTTGSFLPQVVKIIKIKETRDISLMMYVILAMGVLFWLTYGILTQDLPIIIANLITFVFTMIIVLLKIKHG